ncbi:MAG: Asp-tRNA(Asn)/Glu-tRNA(Gln) amidotransferase subunit GatB [bacterium]|nr:Asp-tRNA(Asn)/Glu-tRNA(Gln) amidotransferase subunit GatB [bacterium]
MKQYIPTIGLEVHAELKTATKMFCDCPNDPSEKHPNTNVCPICLGHPGTLPTINKKAIELMITIGYAVKGTINNEFKFDRKNYFYPDLPKGYQISQYDMPIVTGGEINISDRLVLSGAEGLGPKIVKLNRVHLEEDAGKLTHAKDERGNAVSLIDFNRGGLPLMEMVSEPDMHSADEAVAFAKELRLILQHCGVADADLEHGQMRFDANISVSDSAKSQEPTVLGTKVEIKNLNSFGALESAIHFEIKRQTDALEDGKKIAQETRGWDDVKKVTISQRSKEAAHDYRYFPEPDLPMLVASGFPLTDLKLAVPELPHEKRMRFIEEFKLTRDQVNILVEDAVESNYFEQAVSELEADEHEAANNEKITLLFNYLNTDLKGIMKERDINFANITITPENFADLIDMLVKKEISTRTAKDLLLKMFENGTDPRSIVAEESLWQVSGERELLMVIKAVIMENPKAVEDYKKGKMQAAQFLVGKAMAALRGRGNPEVLKSLIEKDLK